MRNVEFKFNWARKLVLIIIVTLFLTDFTNGTRVPSKSSRSRSKARSLDIGNYKFDLSRKTSRNPFKIDKKKYTNKEVIIPDGVIDRMSRQIKPSSCKVEGYSDEGVCMFVFDCNQANGTHLGICRDGFYIGSCCRLPSVTVPNEDETLNEIEPKPTKVSTFPTEIITETTTEMPTTTPTPTVKPTNTPTTTEKPLNRTELRDSDFFSENGTVLIRDPKLICGRQFLPSSRIVGGNEAFYGKWPWQISIRTWQNQAKTFIHSCGAALLNENWAITAAHCVDKVLNQDMILRIGDFDLADNNVPFNYTERRVQMVIPHPKFFGPSKTFEYDLALIRFYEPVVFKPNIIPICIPDKDDDFVDRLAVVTGWGRLYEDGPIPARLNEVQVPIMTNAHCEEMFLKAGYIEKIPNIFLCGGWPEGGKDSCEGDSGGSATLETGPDNHWTLIGVISWGIGCSRVNHPGVYTRITEFRDWINLVTEF